MRRQTFQHNIRGSNVSSVPKTNSAFDRQKTLEVITRGLSPQCEQRSALPNSARSEKSEFKTGLASSVRHDQDSQLSLFGESFDTLSETGRCEFFLDQTFSPTPTLRSGGSGVVGGVIGRKSHQTYLSSGRNVDIALPDLHHDVASTLSDCSFGDLSPIKLVYNHDGTSGQFGSSNNNHLYASGHHRRGVHEFGSFHGLDSTQWNNFPPPSSLQYHRNSTSGAATTRHPPAASNPYFVLRSARKAFENCKYLLPCMKRDDLCTVHISDYGHIHHYREDNREGNVTDIDLRIAVRRVETAICGFGGSLDPLRKQEAFSIFRLKGDASRRQLYEKSLQGRYYLSGSHILWEVEKEPPIYMKIDVDENNGRLDDSSHTANVTENMSTDQINGELCNVNKNRSSSASADDNSNAQSGCSDTNSKLKYRCKLCGQPKQSHNCPFQQSLARSIGVMVYPAVNSFTAAEPGLVAPSLTKMNNFVSYDSDQGSQKPSGAPNMHQPNLNNITPDNHHNGEILSSPFSSMSNHSDEDPPSRSSSAPRRRNVDNLSAVHGNLAKRARLEGLDETITDHRYSLESPTRHAIFVSSVILRPEHYRAVTPKLDELSEPTATAYSYPVVPLTFSERKRLSDTLFHLSKKIPSLTADCALVLREGRKNNEWDLAVAEMLTQVIVGLFCVEGDCRLDGLQQYLLSIGISC